MHYVIDCENIRVFSERMTGAGIGRPASVRNERSKLRICRYTEARTLSEEADFRPSESAHRWIIVNFRGQQRPSSNAARSLF